MAPDLLEKFEKEIESVIKVRFYRTIFLESLYHVCLRYVIIPKSQHGIFQRNGSDC